MNKNLIVTSILAAFLSTSVFAQETPAPVVGKDGAGTQSELSKVAENKDNREMIRAAREENRDVRRLSRQERREEISNKISEGDHKLMKAKALNNIRDGRDGMGRDGMGRDGMGR